MRLLCFSIAFLVFSIPTFAFDFEIWLDTKLKAPGPGPVDQINQLQRLEYYRWLYQISNRRTFLDLKEWGRRAASPEQKRRFNKIDYIKKGRDLFPKIFLEENELVDRSSFALVEDFEAEEGQDIFAEMRESKGESFDPDSEEHLAAYKAALPQVYEALFSSEAPGPFLDTIWSWYEKESAYENKTKLLGQDTWETKGRQEFILGYLLDLKFEPSPKLIRSIEKEKRRILDVEKELSRINASEIRDLVVRHIAFSTLIDETKPPVLGNFTYRSFIEKVNVLEREKRAFGEELKETLSKGELSKEDADLIAAILGEVEESGANRVFLPEVLQKIQANSRKIYVDTKKALYETLSKEKEGTLPLRKTIGFEAYAIVPASVKSILTLLAFKRGRLQAGIPQGESFSVTYPVEETFSKRREIFYDRRKLWGPGAYLNHSTKRGGGFVKDLTNMIAVLQRGNEQDGYDLITQFLGGTCLDEQFSEYYCKTNTDSMVTAIFIRPLEPKEDGTPRTAYKILSRYIGQYQPFGFRERIFNPKRVYNGMVEFVNESVLVEKGGKLKRRKQ